VEEAIVVLELRLVEVIGPGRLVLDTLLVDVGPFVEDIGIPTGSTFSALEKHGISSAPLASSTPNPQLSLEGMGLEPHWLSHPRISSRLRYSSESHGFILGV
jgi:hypothetical protein